MRDPQQLPVLFRVHAQVLRHRLDLDHLVGEALAECHAY